MKLPCQRESGSRRILAADSNDNDFFGRNANFDFCGKSQANHSRRRFNATPLCFKFDSP